MTESSLVRPSFLAIADESGTHAGSPCYTIGCFIVPADRAESIASGLQGIRARYKVTDEIKWTKLGSFNARTEAAFEGVRYMLAQGARFDAIVTEKSSFNKWQKDHEAGFYHSYYELARNVAKAGLEVTLLIDERSDRYARRAEVIEIVTNRSLTKGALGGSVKSVEMVDSKSIEILQYVDVLVGAINADTARYLDENYEMNSTKEEMIRRLSDLIGWDQLRYDSMPNHFFNVWHFPTEFRARPASRQANLEALLRLRASA